MRKLVIFFLLLWVCPHFCIAGEKNPTQPQTLLQRHTTHSTAAHKEIDDAINHARAIQRDLLTTKEGKNRLHQAINSLEQRIKSALGHADITISSTIDQLRQQQLQIDTLQQQLTTTKRQLGKEKKRLEITLNQRIAALEEQLSHQRRTFDRQQRHLTYGIITALGVLVMLLIAILFKLPLIRLEKKLKKLEILEKEQTLATARNRLSTEKT